jgi:hypothetical protein
VRVFPGDGGRQASRALLAPFQGAVRVSWAWSGGCTTGYHLANLQFTHQGHSMSLYRLLLPLFAVLLELKTHAAETAAVLAKLVTTWGQEGEAPGDFHIPIGIAINSRGELFVVIILPSASPFGTSSFTNVRTLMSPPSTRTAFTGRWRRHLAKHGDFHVHTATLDEPEEGLPPVVLDQTDVLLWWGHAAHDQVSDELVTRVQQRVLAGMGLIVLHSGHWSKVFKRLMGTSCALCWREAGERERVWVVNPGHPIAAGLGDCIEIEQSEMYGEPFGIPTPDELIFVSWFQGGEVFRSGATWTRGSGRIFYFSPGMRCIRSTTIPTCSA